MKILAHIAAVLLGAAFLMASLTVLLNLMPDQPKPPEGSPAAMFFGAFGPTGYLHFVKVMELIGAILVMIPTTRNWGLLILGPIIVNIIAFHFYVGEGPSALVDPMMIVIGVCSIFLLVVERKKWLGLLN